MTGKKWIPVVLSLCILSLVCASSAFAQMKIGVVDIQKVVDSSAAGKIASTHLQKKKEALQKKLQTDQKALIDLKKEIEKKSSAWSEDKRAEMARDFQKKQRDLQSESSDARFELKQMWDKELKPIIESLRTVIQTYGEKNGYTVILDSKSGVPYYSPKIDVTSSIIKDLNTATKSK